MKLGGAIAVGEFTPTGELVTYKGDLPEETARLIAKLCAANSLMGSTEMDSLTRVTGMDWHPFHGWAISAGNYSVCVMGNIGVFVETGSANFNDIYKVLGEEAHITLKAA
jgi:roadblock/LC7 domain-containing protein